MARIPIELFILNYVLILGMVAVFSNGLASLPLQSPYVRLPGLALFVLGLGGLALFFDIGLSAADTVTNSMTSMLAMILGGLSLRRGTMNRRNAIQGIGLSAAGVFLAWTSLIFLMNDFGGTWPAYVRPPRGAEYLLFPGMAMIYLGNEACAVLSGVSGALCLCKAARLLRVPNAAEVEAMFRSHCLSAGAAQAAPLRISPDPEDNARDTTWWWHLYSRLDWRAPQCVAHLRTYVEAGGPIFRVTGIPLRDGFLHPNREVMNRLLDAGAVNFRPALGRFELTARGVALLTHPPEVRQVAELRT